MSNVTSTVGDFWRTPMRRIQRVHFIGIGGAGMSGIAEVLFNLGYTVSGSDTSSNVITQRLQKIGVKVFSTHLAEQVENVDVVVVSSAIANDNAEVQQALQQRIPVVPRAEMLAEIMRFRQGIAVSGTHGKTTTTSLVASVLTEGGLDPTFVIGGRLNNMAANAQLGKSDYLVAEADESDASFLYLKPVISIVTNIDADHLATYEGSFDKLKQTFREFLHHLPFYGLAVLCIDDPVVSEMLPKINRPIITYSVKGKADIYAKNIITNNGESYFDVYFSDEKTPIKIHLNLPGKHNVQNALAAIAVAKELGVENHAIQKSLSNFVGIGRRFQRLGTLNINSKEIELVDDYGHHPTEIKATIEAIRESWPDRRLVVAFQPHRYTRTRDLIDDFAAVLSDVDILCLSEVYSAGEKKIATADGRALSNAIRIRGKVTPIFIDDIQKLPETLSMIIQDQDILLTLGAGNIGAVANDLFQTLSSL